MTTVNEALERDPICRFPFGIWENCTVKEGGMPAPADDPKPHPSMRTIPL